MRNLLLTAAAAAIGLGMAGPALAQDAPPVADAPFTGFRAEGVAGYDSLSDGSDQDSSSSSGVLYGGAIGYDVQFRGLVLGVEGELTGSTTDTRADDLLVTGDRFRLDAGRDLYAGGRVGYGVSPDALIYAKGGYTNFRLEERYDVGATSVDDHQDLDGFRVGAGLEYKLGRNTYLKGEYRYSHYGDVDGYDIDLDRHQVLGGIGVRF